MRSKHLYMAAAAAMVAFSGQAYAASSVQDDTSQAKELVTEAATPVVAASVGEMVATGITAALAPPVPVVPSVPVAPAPAPIGGPAPISPSGPTPSGGGSTSAPATGPSGPNGSAPADGQSFNTRTMNGLAGGGAPKAMGMWFMAGYTDIEGSDLGGEFDGDSTVYTVGVDFKPSDESVLGVAVAFENTDVTTKFNTGTFKGDGYTISPYGALILSNGAVIDAMLGMSKVSYDTTANGGAVKSSFDGTRYIGSLNISKAMDMRSVTLTPKAGVMQITEDQDSYVDSTGTAADASTIRLGRASAGATVAFKGKVSPYIRAMAEYDYKKGAAADLGNGRLASNDKFGINAAVGINAQLNDKLSLNVEGSSSANLRNNLDVYGISGRLRYDF